MTTALGAQSVEELQDFADRASSLTQALGTKVTVLGLSLGAVLGLWLAQMRPLDRVVAIAPFLMPQHWTRSLGGATMRTAQLLPDFYWWWDARVRENTKPPYAYPGYPIHALAQITFLGDAIFDLAANVAPRTRRCTIVLNVDDNGINNDVARELLALWRRRDPSYAELTLRDLGLPRHDIIDPTTFPAARTLVYPLLERLAAS